MSPSVHRAAPALTSTKAELRQLLAQRLPAFTAQFRRADANGNGLIEKVEFRHCVQSMIHADDASCDALFDEIDYDSSGDVSYTECLRYALLDILGSQAKRVWNLFKLWDADNSGTIVRVVFALDRGSSATRLPRPLLALTNHVHDLQILIAHSSFSRRIKKSSDMPLRHWVLMRRGTPSTRSSSARHHWPTEAHDLDETRAW